MLIHGRHGELAAALVVYRYAATALDVRTTITQPVLCGVGCQRELIGSARACWQDTFTPLGISTRPVGGTGCEASAYPATTIPPSCRNKVRTADSALLPDVAFEVPMPLVPNPLSRVPSAFSRIQTFTSGVEALVLSAPIGGRLIGLKGKGGLGLIVRAERDEREAPCAEGSVVGAIGHQPQHPDAEVVAITGDARDQDAPIGLQARKLLARIRSPDPPGLSISLSRVPKPVSIVPSALYRAIAT